MTNELDLQRIQVVYRQRLPHLCPILGYRHSSILLEYKSLQVPQTYFYHSPDEHLLEHHMLESKLILFSYLYYLKNRLLTVREIYIASPLFSYTLPIDLAVRCSIIVADSGRKLKIIIANSVALEESLQIICVENPPPLKNEMKSRPC